MKTWAALITLFIFLLPAGKLRLQQERSAELAAKKTPAPAAPCQITAIAGVFEDPATWGPPFKANKKAAQLKLDGAPTLIPKPAWLYRDKAVQGVSGKLISNKGWNAASDEEVWLPDGSLHDCLKLSDDDELTWPTHS